MSFTALFINITQSQGRSEDQRQCRSSGATLNTQTQEVPGALKERDALLGAHAGTWTGNGHEVTSEESHWTVLAWEERGCFPTFAPSLFVIQPENKHGTGPHSVECVPSEPSNLGKLKSALCVANILPLHNLTYQQSTLDYVLYQHYIWVWMYCDSTYQMIWMSWRGHSHSMTLTAHLLWRFNLTLSVFFFLFRRSALSMSIY